jgi:uncharacterized protein (TIGR00730 family)
MMKRNINSVAVYCGHEYGNDPQFTRDAARIGELLARNKIKLIFGGGDVGLMGTVASAAINNGGHVVGVSTEYVIAKQEPAHEKIDVKIVRGVNERKQKMFELSDAFIIMPGGISTLNEATDILTMQQIGETKKPIFLLNTSNFWEPLNVLTLSMRRNGFIENWDDYVVYMGDTPQEIIEKIKEY